MTFYRNFIIVFLFIFSCSSCGNLISGLLHDAVFENNLELVLKILLKKEIKVSLHILLKYGGKAINDDVNNVDDIGQTPLHIAASRGHYKIVSYLMFFKVNVNFVNEKDFGYTPLHYIVRSIAHEFANKENLIDCAKILLCNGADIDIKNSKGLTPFGYAEELSKLKDLDSKRLEEIKNLFLPYVAFNALKTGI